MPLQAVGVASASNGSVGDQHYIYECPGYSYNPATHRYTVPNDCHADPMTSNGTHQWIAKQAAPILAADGHTGTANLLNSKITYGYGQGRTYSDLLVEGTVVADTRLNGCTDYGRATGWPIGDHLLNPYRQFGVFSYNRSPSRGWQGFLYPRTGACATAPRVRTNSAKMADEYFNRALVAWRQNQPGNAMVNLGISVHLLEDAGVPSHTHPEVRAENLTVPLPQGGSQRGQDVYPAWSQVHKAEHAVASGGTYAVPAGYTDEGVRDAAGTWLYYMATVAHPYFPYNAATSTIPQSQYKCDVTNYPEECRSDSVALLQQAQRVSAGFIQYFFTKTAGYIPQQSQYDFTYAGQTNAPARLPGGTSIVTLDLKNTGLNSWQNSGAHPMRIGTDRGRDRASAFVSEDWVNRSRVTFQQKVVQNQDGSTSLVSTDTIQPGETARFSFTVTAPSKPGAYREYFQPVIDGVTWFPRDIGIYFPMTVTAPTYTYQWLEQNYPTDLHPGNAVPVNIVVRNTGNMDWHRSGPHPIRLGTYQPQDRASAFATDSWVSSNRAATFAGRTTLDQSGHVPHAPDGTPVTDTSADIIHPGEVAVFTFTMSAPAQTVEAKEYFNLVAEGYTWLNDVGIYWPLSAR